MTESEQWQPSDITDPATGEGGEAPGKRRSKTPSPAETAAVEPPAKPPSSGIMTLDRDHGAGKMADAMAKPVEQDVHTRLKDTTARCVSCYGSWKSGNDGESELTESMHALRRVLARIEIELAANRADDTAQRPIPIPMHRAHQGKN